MEFWKGFFLILFATASYGGDCRSWWAANQSECFSCPDGEYVFTGDALSFAQEGGTCEEGCPLYAAVMKFKMNVTVGSTTKTYSPQICLYSGICPSLSDYCPQNRNATCWDMTCDTPCQVEGCSICKGQSRTSLCSHCDPLSPEKYTYANSQQDWMKYGGECRKSCDLKENSLTIFNESYTIPRNKILEPPSITTQLCLPTMCPKDVCKDSSCQSFCFRRFNCSTKARGCKLCVGKKGCLSCGEESWLFVANISSYLIKGGSFCSRICEDENAKMSLAFSLDNVNYTQKICITPESRCPTANSTVCPPLSENCVWNCEEGWVEKGKAMPSWSILLIILSSTFAVLGIWILYWYCRRKGQGNVELTPAQINLIES